MKHEARSFGSTRKSVRRPFVTNFRHFITSISNELM